MVYLPFRKDSGVGLGLGILHRKDWDVLDRSRVDRSWSELFINNLTFVLCSDLRPKIRV